MSIGDITYAFFRHQTLNQWQVAAVTYSALNQLTLGAVYASSNAGAPVTFTAGTIDVVLDVPAIKRTLIDSVQTLTNKTIGTPRAIGDASGTLTADDSFAWTSQAFTAPRTFTLPSAAAHGVGKPLTIADLFGTVTGTNTLTVARGGSDTINGLTAVVMGSAYQSLTFESDGVSKWVIASGSNIFAPSTGDLKPTHKTTADPGWIIWIDSTIGDASSSAGIRANADTAALFALYYNSYTDSECRLLTSVGALTSRAATGNNSASAFAAHCAIYPPWGPGRSLGIAGSGAGLTARTLGSIAGSETETPTLAKTAAHGHPAASLIKNLATGPWGMNTGLPLLVQLSGETDNAGSGTPLNTLDPTTYINMMIKL